MHPIGIAIGLGVSQLSMNDAGYEGLNSTLQGDSQLHVVIQYNINSLKNSFSHSSCRWKHPLRRGIRDLAKGEVQDDPTQDCSVHRRGGWLRCTDDRHTAE